MIEVNMTAMFINRAIEAVNRAYEPGVVSYYGQLNPDPWQTAHDKLEHILTLDPDSAQVACEEFVKTCIGLIESFKKMGKPSKSISYADAFAIGDENRFKAAWSRKHKECYQCQSNANLSLEPYGTDALEVRVVCPECKGRKSA